MKISLLSMFPFGLVDVLLTEPISYLNLSPYRNRKSGKNYINCEIKYTKCIVSM
ncbi:protein of unknown function [Candidatus Nitrosocosmicus franklandus]|uniref:Uncharacterized protein n=1 Tax=Candidatus Nitrosocosmicus franklandianus TaxID=1798806 RepID=A0A484ICB3_9ARCH|nr:protein of unknown function [Candidatus Nitrosocosmicus franklandus]